MVWWKKTKTNESKDLTARSIFLWHGSPLDYKYILTDARSILIPQNEMQATEMLVVLQIPLVSHIFMLPLITIGKHWEVHQSALMIAKKETDTSCLPRITTHFITGHSVWLYLACIHVVLQGWLMALLDHYEYSVH